MICLQVFLHSVETNNFKPFNYKDNICFTLNEGIEILEIIRLYPIQKEMIEAMQMQQSNNIKIKQLNKKERIRKGLLVGLISGVIGILTGASLTVKLLK